MRTCNLIKEYCIRRPRGGDAQRADVIKSGLGAFVFHVLLCFSRLYAGQEENCGVGPPQVVRGECYKMIPNTDRIETSDVLDCPGG